MRLAVVSARPSMRPTMAVPAPSTFAKKRGTRLASISDEISVKKEVAVTIQTLRGRLRRGFLAGVSGIRAPEFTGYFLNISQKHHLSVSTHMRTPSVETLIQPERSVLKSGYACTAARVSGSGRPLGSAAETLKMLNCGDKLEIHCGGLRGA